MVAGTRIQGWRKRLGALPGARHGAVAIEYGLLAALIAIAALAAMRGSGGQLKSTFNTASSSMSQPAAAPGGPPPAGPVG